MSKSEKESTSDTVASVSDRSRKHITIVFGPSAATQRQKDQTISLFQHLRCEQVVKNNRVVGLQFNIDEFNEAVHKGCAPQKSKHCVSTQTDRCTSPSILCEDSYNLYQKLGYDENI